MVIQKQVRGWLLRRQFKKKKEAAVKIQKIWRGYAARKKYQQVAKFELKDLTNQCFI